MCSSPLHCARHGTADAIRGSAFVLPAHSNLPRATRKHKFATVDGSNAGADRGRTDNGFNNHLSGWFNGDGRIDFDDYVLIDLAFNTQGAALRGSASLGSPGQAGQPHSRARVN
jgi:hypothetical protein